MDDKRKNLIIGLTVVFLAILATIFFYFRHSMKQKDVEMKELVEMMDFEKEQIENDYYDLTTEFNSYTSNLKNDSLVKLLDNEKMKVQQLLEELRITKSTNAKRIAELKKELATVRQVMIQFVNQIDSLNTINKKLTSENVEVKLKYQTATETVQQLSKDKETLNEVVSRASKMEIDRFSFETLNSKNRKTGRLSQIATLQFNFNIAKNVTVNPGEKTVYLRIMRPDDVVLSKSAGDVFQFEDKKIAYSASKKVDYENEAFSDVIYWKVEEILQIGSYRADFFIDGDRVGSFSFKIDK